jgi:hypothetical protein
MSNQTSKLKVEDMLKIVLNKTNDLINAMEGIDPISEAYGVALENLAKSFQILSGALLASRNDKDGGK